MRWLYYNQLSFIGDVNVSCWQYLTCLATIWRALSRAPWDIAYPFILYSLPCALSGYLRCDSAVLLHEHPASGQY